MSGIICATPRTLIIEYLRNFIDNINPHGYVITFYKLINDFLLSYHVENYRGNAVFPDLNKNTPLEVVNGFCVTLSSEFENIMKEIFYVKILNINPNYLDTKYFMFDEVNLYIKDEGRIVYTLIVEN